MTLNEYQIQDKFCNNDIFVMAIDAEGHRCALLRSLDENTAQRLKTDYMILKTNIVMVDENGENKGKYHIIQCLSQDINVNIQFARVCQYMFSNNENPVGTSIIIELFQDIQTLFETTPDTDKHDLQVGVYGEMILIKYFRMAGRNDLADAWHSDFYSKHDIEIDATHRIEIKTTNKEKRVHNFRHNQLVHGNVDIVVASVKVEECEQGTPLYNLMIEAQGQFTDIKKKKLIEKLIKRCDLSEEDTGIICDEQHSFNNIRFYKAADVPHISSEIPAGVTNVSYDVSFDANLPIVDVKDI